MGYFALPGLTGRPSIYEISHLLEGCSYCTHSVIARQSTTAFSTFPLPTGSWDPSDVEKELGKIRFACICSFKRDEPVDTKHQAIVNLEEAYREIIKGKKPEDHLLQPHVDAPWYAVIFALLSCTLPSLGLLHMTQ
jgi:hypothetical protein